MSDADTLVATGAGVLGTILSEALLRGRVSHRVYDLASTLLTLTLFVGACILRGEDIRNVLFLSLIALGSGRVSRHLASPPVEPVKGDP